MSEPHPASAFLELAGRSRQELAALMVRGTQPDMAALSGWEFRGLNTAPWMRAVGADRFVKGFAAGRGYNRRVKRGARSDPWLSPGRPEPEPFAPFTVAPVDPEAPDNRYLHALLLDYGALASGPLDPAGRIRDYLVEVEGSAELLLGHAFVAVGRTRLQATFFVLERLRRAPEPTAGAA